MWSTFAAFPFAAFPSSHSLRTIATATRAPTLDVTEALISLMLWARGAKPAAR
jgi:hypothetical protein